MHQNHQNNQQYQHSHNHLRPSNPSLYLSRTHTQKLAHTPQNKQNSNQLPSQNPSSKRNIPCTNFQKRLGLLPLHERQSKPKSKSRLSLRPQSEANMRQCKQAHVTIPNRSIVFMGGVTWIPTESIEGSYRQPRVKRGKREMAALSFKSSPFPARPRGRASKVKGLASKMQWWEDQSGRNEHRNGKLSEESEKSASFELARKARGTIERIKTLFKWSAKGEGENVRVVVLAKGEELNGKDKTVRRELSFEFNDDAEYMPRFKGLQPAQVVKTKEYRAQISIPPHLSVYTPSISDVQATRKRQEEINSKRHRYIRHQRNAEGSTLRSPGRRARLSVKTYVPSGLPHSRSWRLGNRHGPSHLYKVDLPEDDSDEDKDESEEVNLRGGAGSLVDLELKVNHWDRLRSSNSSANSITDQNSPKLNNKQDHEDNLQIACQLSTRKNSKSRSSIKRIVSSYSPNQYRGNSTDGNNPRYLKMSPTSQRSLTGIAIDDDSFFLSNKQLENKTKVVVTGADSIEERRIEMSSKDMLKCRGLSSNVFATPGEPSTAGPNTRNVVAGATGTMQDGSRLSPQDALKCRDPSANVFATPIDEPTSQALIRFIGIVEETGYREMSSNFMGEAHSAIQEPNQAVDANAIANARSKPTLNPGARHSDLELELAEAMGTRLSSLPDITWTRCSTRHAQNTGPRLAINKLHDNNNMDRQAIRSTSWELVDEPADSLDPGFFEREVTEPSVPTDLNSRAMNSLTQDFASSSLAPTSTNGIENLDASLSKPRSNKSSLSRSSSLALPASMSRSWQTTHLKEEDPVDDEILHPAEFDEISGENKLKATLKAKGASLFSKCTRLTRPIKHSALLTTAQAKTLTNACARRPSSCLPVANSASHSDDWVEINRDGDF